MDEENNTQNETAEELEAEKQQLAEVKEDEVRSQIISTYGFNEEDDRERIDKAVEREMEHQKALKTAIGQKVKYRTQFQELNKTAKSSEQKPPESKDNEVDLDAKLDEKLDKRELAALDYPDDIKKAIDEVSKIEKVPVRKAVENPYVQAKIEAYNKQKEAEEAALTRKNQSGSKATWDIDNPPDVDMNTEEGRNQYDNWKKDMIKQGY